MRTSIFSILTCTFLFSISCSSDLSEDNKNDGETDFYYIKEEGKEGYSLCELKIRKDKVIIKCKSNDEAKVLSGQSIFISAYDAGEFVIATINPKKLNLDDLMKRQDVVSATYGLEYIDGNLLFPTGCISVKFKEGLVPENVLDENDLLENITAIELLDPYSEVYRIFLNVKLGDILPISRSLFECGLVEFAVPGGFLIMKMH